MFSFLEGKTVGENGCLTNAASVATVVATTPRHNAEEHEP